MGCTDSKSLVTTKNGTTIDTKKNKESVDSNKGNKTIANETDNDSVIRNDFLSDVSNNGKDFHYNSFNVTRLQNNSY